MAGRVQTETDSTCHFLFYSEHISSYPFLCLLRMIIFLSRDSSHAHVIRLRLELAMHHGAHPVAYFLMKSESQFTSCTCEQPCTMGPTLWPISF